MSYQRRHPHTRRPRCHQQRQCRWRGPTETTPLASFTRLVGPNVLLITDGVEFAGCGISSAANPSVAAPKNPNRYLQGENVLTVPVGALFRVGEDWAVFTVKEGRARITFVKVDHRNDRLAEVVSGLSEGDQVILHPSDRITDGVVVEERPN